MALYRSNKHQCSDGIRDRHSRHCGVRSEAGLDRRPLKLVGVGLEVVDHLDLGVLHLAAVLLNLRSRLAELVIGLVLGRQVSGDVVVLLLEIADLHLQIVLHRGVSVDLGLQLGLLISDAGDHLAELIVQSHLIHLGLLRHGVKVHQLEAPWVDHVVHGHEALLRVVVFAVRSVVGRSLKAVAACRMVRVHLYNV